MRGSDMGGCARVLIAAMLLMMPVAAHAADKDNRDREALRRVQQNAAKLQAEKTALEREKQELTVKVDAATKGLDGLKSEAARSRRQAAALDKEVAALRKENDELKSRLEASGKSLVESGRQCQDAATLAQQNQKRAETVTANLKAMVAKEEAERNTCQTNILKLRAVAQEILVRYQNKGVFESLRQAEPFTGIKSVEIENVVQDYQDRINDLNAVKQP